MKDVTYKVGSNNPDGSITLVPTGSTAMVPAGGAPVLGGYRAEYMGMNVWFESEADYRRADAMIRRSMMMDDGRGGSGPGGMGAGFLRTGAETAETISSFFQTRNLQRRRNDYLDAIENSKEQINKLGQLQGKYPDLIPILLDTLQSERDQNEAALQLLDDQITAVDIQAGAGVAKVVDDVWPRGGRYSAANGGGGALAAGAVGLGLGWLAFSRGRRHNGR